MSATVTDTWTNSGMRPHKTLLPHGGGVREASRVWGIPPGEWLDLSTGINPRGWPVPGIPENVWNRLPEDGDDLESVARAYYGCQHLLPAAGSQAIIQTLPRLLAKGPIGVMSPTYAEHAHAWYREGFEVTTLDEVSDTLLDRLRVLIVVNPNNPTARVIPKTTLLTWWQRLQHHGGWLIVDEAFMDAAARESVAADSGRAGLLVLRSLGKFFGLAGARVGFLLAHPSVLQAVRAELGPWNVAGPSRWIARAALADHSWVEKTREHLQQGSQRLCQLLTSHGLTVQGRTALFQWVPRTNPGPWYENLARLGILVRKFDDPPGLRFGLPGSEADWKRLTLALEHCVTVIPPRG